MKTLTTIILVVLATLQAIKAEQHEDHNQHHHKKEELGFFGSRGKRNIDPERTTLNEVEDSEATLKELTNLRNSIMGMQRSVRAPKGFFGMRGKKDYDMQLQEEKRALLGVQQNSNGLRERTRFVEPLVDENDGYPSYLPKRNPQGSQGFFGMRGKKFGDYDLGGSLNDKRAPMGFMGMRGKKSGPDTFEDEGIDDPQVFDYNYNSIYDKRAPSGFMGMRGKKLSSEHNKSPLNLMFR